MSMLCFPTPESELLLQKLNIVHAADYQDQCHSWNRQTSSLGQHLKNLDGKYIHDFTFYPWC